MTLPKTTKDVGEQLNEASKSEKEQARSMLRLILSSIRFLARQGLALRGSGSDESANLIQLLRLRGEDDPNILTWLEKSARKHTAPENQNEMLEIMSHAVLRNILDDIRSSPFFAVMVDETTDKSNNEQLTMVLRWVTEDFVVSEEFLGLYGLSRTDAQSIANVIQDAFLRFQLSFSKLRGQCYDGCSTMAGAKAGVAARIEQIESRAVFTHCYGHALNLAVADTIKGLPALKDCLDTSFEIIKLVKFSPKREAMLHDMKEQDGSCDPGLRTLCPTRWTVRAEALDSILQNYEALQKLWEAAVQQATNTEIKARIQGVDSQMQTFKFFFGLLLSELILRHTDKLSQSLQDPDMTTVEGHENAMLTVRTLESLRTEDNFDLFWEAADMKRQRLNVDEPKLGRKRRAPARFEEGSAPAEFPSSAKDEFRRIYFEGLDLAVESIRSRFEQKGFKTLSNVEQLLFKACKGEQLDKELYAVCLFFGDDFVRGDLLSELNVFRELYKCKEGKATPTVSAIRCCLLAITERQRQMVSSLCRLFQLLLIMPATNATSERSLSALRCIKTFLRSTMGQARLNHLMLLHYHQDRTDGLDLKKIANEYIEKNETRKSTFAMFH